MEGMLKPISRAGTLSAAQAAPSPSLEHFQGWEVHKLCCRLGGNNKVSCVWDWAITALVFRLRDLGDCPGRCLWLIPWEVTTREQNTPDKSAPTPAHNTASPAPYNSPAITHSSLALPVSRTSECPCHPQLCWAEQTAKAGNKDCFAFPFTTCFWPIYIKPQLSCSHWFSISLCEAGNFFFCFFSEERKAKEQTTGISRQWPVQGALKCIFPAGSWTACSHFAKSWQNAAKIIQSFQKWKQPKKGKAWRGSIQPGHQERGEQLTAAVPAASRYPHTPSHRRNPAAPLLPQSRALQSRVWPALPELFPVKHCLFSGQGCQGGTAQLCTLSFALAFLCPLMP